MSRGLSRLSTQELHAEIRRRAGGVRRLEHKRDKLAAKLAIVERQIASLDGNANGVPGRRHQNKLTLLQTLAKVLSGKTMSVTEAAEAVRKAGYRTGSLNFRTQVNIALIKGNGFKRVGRGQYTAK